MTDFDRFDQHAPSRGVLIDANLLVLLIVGAVNRERIHRFKRTSSYSPADCDLLTGILEKIPHRFATAHILAEVSNLTDLREPELAAARDILCNFISQVEELPIPSSEACKATYFRRLGLTDAAIGLAAKQRGCLVITNDSDLYRTLSEEGASVVKFDRLRETL